VINRAVLVLNFYKSTGDPRYNLWEFRRRNGDDRKAENGAAFGAVGFQSRARQGEARRGEARRGEARWGEVRRGEARRGEARWGEAKRIQWIQWVLQIHIGFSQCVRYSQHFAGGGIVDEMHRNVQSRLRRVTAAARQQWRSQQVKRAQGV